MKKLFKWISISAVIFSSIWFAFDYWTAVRMEKVCQDWPLLDRNLTEFTQVYPATTGGQSTKDIQVLYEKVSLSTPQDTKGNNTRDLLREYLRTELAKPVSAIKPMPTDIKRALVDNQEIIEKITVLLLTEPTLSLPLKLDIRFAESIPANSAWIRPINELLVANALASQSTGEMFNAWRYLRASSRLTDALFHHPWFISQMLAIVESKNILLAMRKMTAPAPDWALDWPNHDLVKWTLTAYTAEAYIMQNIEKKENFSDFLVADREIRKLYGLPPVEIGKVTKIIYSLIGRQLIRLHVSKQVTDSRRMIQVRFSEGLCIPQPSEIDSNNENLSFWYPGKDVLSDLISSNLLYRYWNSLYLLVVNKTGTQIILRTKAIKAQSANNHWPPAPSIPADTCLEHLWSYQHKPDNSVIFSYDKPLPKDVPLSMVKPGYLKYIGNRIE